jgi:hypothetical protein
MKSTLHDAKRAAFWLVLAATFIMGLLLLFYMPTQGRAGSDGGAGAQAHRLVDDRRLPVGRHSERGEHARQMAVAEVRL